MKTLDVCGSCGGHITGSAFVVEGVHYHKDCFMCNHCGRSLSDGDFSPESGHLLCGNCSREGGDFGRRSGQGDGGKRRGGSSSGGPSRNQRRSTEPLLPDASPWRKVKPWSKETYEEIKESIISYKLLKESDISNINVLLLGEIGAGKSSFFNSVNSVFRGFVTSLASAGSMQRSVTTQYREYKVRAGDRKSRSIKFRFCDTMGLEENASLEVSDIEKIIEGRVRDQTELSGGRILPNKQGYREHPTLNHQMHCVVFVLAADTISLMASGIRDKFIQIRDQAIRRRINPIVLITKIDKLCTHTEMDVSKVFHSNAVNAKVLEVQDMLGIPPMNIHPVRNYFSETEVEVPTDILTLMAVRQIQRSADMFLQDMLDREKEEEKELREMMKSRKHSKLHEEGILTDSD